MPLHDSGYRIYLRDEHPMSLAVVLLQDGQQVSEQPIPLLAAPSEDIARSRLTMLGRVASAITSYYNVGGDPLPLAAMLQTLLSTLAQSAVPVQHVIHDDGSDSDIFRGDAEEYHVVYWDDHTDVLAPEQVRELLDVNAEVLSPDPHA